jgi:hypothetical protein
MRGTRTNITGVAGTVSLAVLLALGVWTASHAGHQPGGVRAAAASGVVQPASDAGPA